MIAENLLVIVKLPILGIAIEITIVTSTLTIHMFWLYALLLETETQRKMDFPTHYYIGKLSTKSLFFLWKTTKKKKNLLKVKIKGFKLVDAHPIVQYKNESFQKYQKS